MQVLPEIFLTKTNKYSQIIDVLSLEEEGHVNSKLIILTTFVTFGFWSRNMVSQRTSMILGEGTDQRQKVLCELPTIDKSTLFGPLCSMAQEYSS